MPAKKQPEQILVATESGSTEIKGETFNYVKGVTRIRSNHPLAKAAADYFEPADDNVHYDVEKATSAPGEKRGE